jgi:ribokinase
MKSQPHLLVVGSSNTDLIVRAARIPQPGETILGGEFHTAAGGKGANQAVAAARAGGKVTFVARLGCDASGRAAFTGFRREGINTRFIVRDARTPSGIALITVNAHGQNSIAVAPGANARLSAADLRRAAPAIATADALLVQLETPLRAVTAAVKLAARNQVPVLLNPAPAQPLPDSLLRHLRLLTPNETEAEILTGVKVTGPDAALRAAIQLRARGVDTVIVTLGARGALVVSETVRRHVPGFKVRARDTTAAGDVFNGALAVALAERQELLAAVQFANAAAALSVTRLGAQPSAPWRSEIERFLSHRS